MWVEARVRAKRDGYGQNWLLRIGTGHLRVLWAWHLAWEQYWPSIRQRAHWTKDGWIFYFDAYAFHVKLQWHWQH